MEPISNRKGENDLGYPEKGNHGTGEEMVAQQGEEGPVTKKPRVEVEVEDEDEEGLTNLKSFRKNWLKVMSPFVGPLEAISKFSSSRSPHNMTQSIYKVRSI